jgi:hypothetical protein
MPDTTIIDTLASLIAEHGETTALHNRMNDGDESDRIGDRLIEIEDKVIAYKAKNLCELAIKSRFIMEVVQIGTPDFHAGRRICDKAMLDQQGQGYYSIIKDIERMADNLNRTETMSSGFINLEHAIFRLKSFNHLLQEIHWRPCEDKADIDARDLLIMDLGSEIDKLHESYSKTITQSS